MDPNATVYDWNGPEDPEWEQDDDDKTVVSTTDGTEIVLTKDTKTGVTSIVVDDKEYCLDEQSAQAMGEWLARWHWSG